MIFDPSNESLIAPKKFLWSENYNNIYHHIGIYSYKVNALEKFVSLSQSKNEIQNKLEQLRALDNNLSEMLKSDVFIELFNSVFRDSNAVEYYLLDTSGSYLFLDKEGYPTWLIIRSEHDFNVQLETLSGLDAEEKLINDLTSREKLLFMLSEEEYQEPVGEWNNSLFEAKELTSPLWYSIKKGPIKTAVDWKQIKAYQGSK